MHFKIACTHLDRLKPLISCSVFAAPGTNYPRLRHHLAVLTHTFGCCCCQSHFNNHKRHIHRRLLSTLVTTKPQHVARSFSPSGAAGLSRGFRLRVLSGDNPLGAYPEGRPAPLLCHVRAFLTANMVES